MESLTKQMLVAAATRKPLEVPFLSETTISFVTKNGLAAMLCYLSEQGEGAALCSSERQLKGAGLTAKVLTKTLISAMTQIIDHCQNRVEKIVLLKGISISEQYYPTPEIRPMRDIDFLVQKKDLEKVEQILFQLGYQQESDLPKSFFADYHHSMPFFNPETGVWVEVHTGLFSGKKSIPNSQVFDIENVLGNLVKSTFNEREVYRLSDEYQLLYTAAHWCLEFKEYGGSIALFDIIYLIENSPALDWDSVSSTIDSDVLGWCLYIALGYLKENHALDIDEKLYNKIECQNKIGDKIKSRILFNIIDKYIVAESPFGNVLTPGNVGIIWNTLLKGSQPLLNVLSIPFNLVLPPNNPRRFNLKYQLQRLRNCFRLSANERR